MFETKCFLIIFVDTRTREITRAQRASDYPVTQLGGTGHLRQMCVLKTRGQNYDEASRRMKAILKTPDYAWLRPVLTR